MPLQPLKLINREDLSISRLMSCKVSNGCGLSCIIKRFVIQSKWKYSAFQNFRESFLMGSLPHRHPPFSYLRAMLPGLRTLLLLLLLFSIASASSQSILLKGIIKDAHSDERIPFASI